MSSKKITFWIKAETFTATARIDTSMFDDPYAEAATQVLEFIYALRIVGWVDYWKFKNVSIRTTNCERYNLGHVFYVSRNKMTVGKKYFIKYLAANAGLWSFVETINMMERICDDYS